MGMDRMAEIQIQYKELKDHIRALINLAAHLENRNFLTTQLLNESTGNTCSELNETYHILCEAEISLKNLIVFTAQWLEMAEELFGEKEKDTIRDTDRILHF